MNVYILNIIIINLRQTHIASTSLLQQHKKAILSGPFFPHAFLFNLHDKKKSPFSTLTAGTPGGFV